MVLLFFFFFFNDTATTEIYTLSLHDALPILLEMRVHRRRAHGRYGGSERRRRGSGPWCTSAADGDHRDGDQPFQGHVWLLFKGSFGASHAVNRPPASAVGFAGEHERREIGRA